MKNNLTALMCLFVKAYHKRNSNIILYDDLYSSEIINDNEYDLVLNSLLQGKDFFKVNDNVDKVKIIINSFLAPSILARSIISEKLIINNINESLANKANEKMLSKYKTEEMNSLIKNNNYTVANLYDSAYINEELFAPYNEINNEKLIAKNDVSYCVIKTN